LRSAPGGGLLFRMEVKQVVMVLADISGYTRFLRSHTTSLLHAEAIITELLEAVINHAEHPLTLSKLEGDAAFMYAPLEGDECAVTQDVLRQVTAFFEAFKARERALIACDACVCDACRNIAQLKLKAFLHIGEAAIKKIRQFEELGGEEAILIHRLLKNTVPAKEYTLMTQAFYDVSGGLDGRTPETRIEACEGIGDVTVKVYYPEGEEPPLPPQPAPLPPMPGTEAGALADRFNRYAVRRTLGREQPQFAHLPNQKLGPRDLFGYFVGGIGSGVVKTIRYYLTQK